MTTILLVDDEPFVTKSLARMLARERPEWRTMLATSGAMALESLEHASVQVVVSDLRMPGMDGVKLLTKIRAAHPTMARIVLSGHAEATVMEAAAAVAHEVLAKPCAADALIACIERLRPDAVTCDPE